MEGRRGRSDAEVAKRLALAPFFRGLGDDVLIGLAGASRLSSLKGDEALWREGAYAYELAFVWEGELRVARRAGGHVTFRAVPINGVIGYSNAIGRAPCSVDVVAGQASRVLLVPGDALRNAIPRCPEIAYRAFEALGALIASLSDDIQMLHTTDLRERILHRVRRLAQGRSEIQVTHAALAEQVAARRESVTRALADLEAEGFVRLARGRIHVLDLGDRGK